MPVTKTAKRALRVSKRKRITNKVLISKMETAIRAAEKNPTSKNVKTAISFADRAAKKNIIHKNKAARIKSRLDRQNKTKTNKAKGNSKKKK
jgi:small subunit ribosomal protein S20